MKWMAKKRKAPKGRKQYRPGQSPGKTHPATPKKALKGRNNTITPKTHTRCHSSEGGNPTNRQGGPAI
jgi:hypothetical protein